MHLSEHVTEFSEQQTSTSVGMFEFLVFKNLLVKKHNSYLSNFSWNVEYKKYTIEFVQIVSNGGLVLKKLNFKGKIEALVGVINSFTVQKTNVCLCVNSRVGTCK